MSGEMNNLGVEVEHCPLKIPDADGSFGHETEGVPEARALHESGFDLSSFFI
jgi:hypothetical protein